MYFPSSGRDEPIYEQTVDGKPAGEKADHSWSAIFVDENQDGYPDLVVSTDEGDRLRVYLNDKGHGFVRDKRFDDDKWEGCWMGAAAGDLDGDGQGRAVRRQLRRAVDVGVEYGAIEQGKERRIDSGAGAASITRWTRRAWRTRY